MKDEKVKQLQELAIWMTGCGYDFTQHDYYLENRHLFTDDLSNQQNEVECSCEVGRMYNNLCCPIHGHEDLKQPSKTVEERALELYPIYKEFDFDRLEPLRKAYIKGATDNQNQ